MGTCNTKFDADESYLYLEEGSNGLQHENGLELQNGGKRLKRAKSTSGSNSKSFQFEEIRLEYQQSPQRHSPRPVDPRKRSSSSSGNAEPMSPQEISRMSMPIEFSELEIGEKIGEGSFGMVCLANWHGGQVAIKRLLNQSNDAANLADFQHEAEMNYRLGHHPRVVSFYGICMNPLSLVLGFMELRSVYNVVVKQKRWTKPHELLNILQIAQDAAAGLSFLHHRGVIHRDVSARNFLLDNLGRATIADFGMARFLGRKLSLGEGKHGRQLPDGNGSKLQDGNNTVGSGGYTDQVFGPLKWMAPEALTAREYSELTDTYMFGIFLWELFARTQPYPRLTSKQAVQGVVRGVLRPSKLRPSLCPAPIMELMQRCWSHTASKRPVMKDVYKELEDIHKHVSEELKKMNQSPAKQAKQGVVQGDAKVLITVNSSPTIQHIEASKEPFRYSGVSLPSDGSLQPPDRPMGVAVAHSDLPSGSRTETDLGGWSMSSYVGFSGESKTDDGDYTPTESIACSELHSDREDADRDLTVEVDGGAPFPSYKPTLVL